MCKALLLKKETHLAVRVKEPAAVGLAMEQIKEGEEVLEFFFAGKKITSGSSGALIEAIDEVNNEEDASGGEGGIHVLVHASTDDVEDKIKATFDSNPKLAEGSKVSSKGGTKGLHDVFAQDATIGKTHSNGTEFVRFIGVFVECHKIIGGQMDGHCRGNLIVDDKLTDITEGF